MLKKPHGAVIGPVGHYFGLEMELKFNEMSEVTFSYPKYVDGKATPFFNDLTPGKLLQIDPFGVFIISKVEEESEGMRCVREVTAYSREYEFAGKQVVFAAGRYNFWNSADVENTVMGILLSYARNWKMGSVSPSLIGRYRTFDDTDVKALDFMLDTLQETYGCVFVFDTYNRIINVVDAEEDIAMVPVYVSSQNLIKEATVKTSADNIITKLYVCGADGVSIRNVNPTGDNYIYNLDYYISIGDLPADLAAKWVTWQNEIFTKQPLYTSLVALRNSAQSRLVVEKAKLTDLNGKLFTLDNTRATFLQMQMDTQDDATYDYFAERLTETAAEYSDIEAEIATQEALIAEIQADYDAQLAQIVEINNELKLSTYFTADELDILDTYFTEDSFTDETFAVFDVDVTGNDDFTSVTSIVQLEYESSVDTEFPAGDYTVESGRYGKFTIHANENLGGAALISIKIGESLCEAEYKYWDWLAMQHVGPFPLDITAGEVSGAKEIEAYCISKSTNEHAVTLQFSPVTMDGAMVRYNKLTDIPTGSNFRNIIELLMDAGILLGDGSDPTGNDDVIDLSQDMVRMFIFNYRAGCYDEKIRSAGCDPDLYK